MTRRTLALTPALLIGLVILAGCQPHHDSAKAESTATTGPAFPSSAPVPRAAASQPSQITWEAKTVRLQYPAGWQTVKNPDFELMIIPPGAPTSGSPENFITFDIPDLPPHLPFMIQMSRVEHDYEADLKKSHPDLKVDSASDVKIPDTTARLLQSTWHQNGQIHNDVALLIIHSSGVYILDAQATEKKLAPTRAAFDAMRASIQWTK